MWKNISHNSCTIFHFFVIPERRSPVWRKKCLLLYPYTLKSVCCKITKKPPDLHCPRAYFQLKDSLLFYANFFDYGYCAALSIALEHANLFYLWPLAFLGLNLSHIFVIKLTGLHCIH